MNIQNDTIASVLEIFKIGIGPSSSHTLGPWRAAQRFQNDLKINDQIEEVESLQVDLYGSLALTGLGHGTDIAVLMGLVNADPVTVNVDDVQRVPQEIQIGKQLHLGAVKNIDFDLNNDIALLKSQSLPYHPNGMIFTAYDKDHNTINTQTYYSIGGGFVVQEGELPHDDVVSVPYPIKSGLDVLAHCDVTGFSIAEIARANEASRYPQLDSELENIWSVMIDSVFQGCTKVGKLPGPLGVVRHARSMVQPIIGCQECDQSVEGWINQIKKAPKSFDQVLKLISAFAMAVNEENASFGRIVTSPTNGSSGVIPAVLLYYIAFSGLKVSNKEINDFLLVAGVVGGIFKDSATISAAMGGCQAEIGVSSAMAAAALTEGMGGSPRQSLMAAEIAMEHHLGLTCDPIGGLVQIPCIERNSMGAVKAITAAHMAISKDPSKAIVSLDSVIKSMWETAKDMNTKYKETSLGGLAVNVSVRTPEC
ncbi:L-serine ammonia-lyase [Spirochaeta cellobiosiphila]|uniref:L-serine ammonia-lyase n=1 Tax=Spirochaeta cellobiosiphila TaxID=504483 RepID=UPI00041FC17A|nr:L-serine ammonia-lyase [Spirochaeta cellobiosiphila]